MAIYFAQASIDERGKITGGSAGNQNGKELNTREVYSSSSNPWLFVVRAKDSNVRVQICAAAKEAVANPYIGYDQWERNTVLTQAKAVGWILSAIKTPCETDCSALAGLCMLCGTYKVLGTAAGNAAYNTIYAGGNLPATSDFKRKVPTQYFDVLGFPGLSQLQAGDVVVRDGHAVIVVDQIVSASGVVSGSTGLASNSYPCKGWTGDEVRKLQSALIAKGYSCGSSGVDGSFGSDTDAAVRRFQRDHGLEDDGIVGTKTQAVLYGSGGSKSVTSNYPLGNYVTVVGELNVRTGAGTGYARKNKGQLTADGQRHSNGSGQLNKGTTVTVMQVQYDGSGNPWGCIPSGWICLNFEGKPYVKQA